MLSTPCAFFNDFFPFVEFKKNICQSHYIMKKHSISIKNYNQITFNQEYVNS